MADTNNEKQVKLISTGNILGGLSRAQVIKKLSQKFSLTPAQAESMLIKNKVLKQALKESSSNQAIRTFADLGLEVVKEVIPVESPASPVTLNETVTSAKSEGLGTGEYRIEPVRFPLSFRDNFYFYFIGPITIGCIMAAFALILLFSASVLFSLAYLATVSLSLGAVGWLVALLVVSACCVLLFAFTLFFNKTFARYRNRQAFVLPKDEAKALVEMVQNICDQLGVAKPNHIQLNQTARVDLATAGGVSDLINGRVVLNIGAPLIASCSIAELRGLLVYALSPLANRAVLRHQLIITSFLDFLYKRSAQSAGWQQAVEDKLIHNKSYWQIYSLALLRRFFDGCDRFYFVLNRACYAVLKQGLLNVNRYALSFEANEVGYHGLLGTQEKIKNIERAIFSAHEINRACLIHRKVFRTFAEAVISCIDIHISDVKNYADGKVRELHELFFEFHEISQNTHKTIDKTLKAVSVHSGESAQRLFRDFAQIDEDITMDCYRGDFYEDIDALDGVARVSALQAESIVVENRMVFSLMKFLKNSDNALSDYMGVDIKGRILELDEPTSPELIQMKLQEVIDWLREKLISYREDHSAIQLIDSDIRNKKLVQLLQKHGVKSSLSDFGGTSKYKYDFKVGAGESSELLFSREYEDAYDHVLAKLHLFDRMYFQRLVQTVYLMAEKEKRPAMHLLSELQDISELKSLYHKLCTEQYCLLQLLCLRSVKHFSKINKAVREQARELSESLMKLIARSSDITVYENDMEENSLRNLILPKRDLDLASIKSMAPGEVAELSREVTESLKFQYVYLLAQLTERCGRTELKHKIKPLKLVARKSSASGV